MKKIETGTIKTWLFAQRWGGRSLVCLYISILSGLIIALQYSPDDPFYSAASLELLVPFGAFWRSLHFYSSQAFFLLLLLHFIMVVWENQHGYKRVAWIRLTATLPVSLLLLFTGYVLRGDATGEAAGIIGEHITLSLPLIGTSLNDLLFAISTEGMKRIYANHLIGLCVLGGWCGWKHLRRYQASWQNHVILVSGLGLFTLCVAAPMEATKLGQVHIAGPWFFLGLQELLRYMPTLWAGIIIPLLLLGALLCLPSTVGNSRRKMLLFIALWLLFYLLVSLMAYSRAV